MNQSSNLNEFVEIAQKKSPSFVIVAFNSAEVWSNTNVLMDHYSSHFKPLKRTKNFHHTEIVNKIHGNLPSPGCPCHSSTANENKDKSKFIKPEGGKFHWVRYEFQCDKSGTKTKVLPAMCNKKNMIFRSIYIFEACVKWSIYMHMLNACGKTWINENNFQIWHAEEPNTNLILSYD